MPSTRRVMPLEDFEVADLPSDDEYGPDYTEGESDSEDDLPATMGRDRAMFLSDNQEALAELFHLFLTTGRQLFGNAFHQTGNMTAFCHYVYRHTTPGAH